MMRFLQKNRRFGPLRHCRLSNNGWLWGLWAFWGPPRANVPLSARHAWYFPPPRANTVLYARHWPGWKTSCTESASRRTKRVQVASVCPGPCTKTAMERQKRAALLPEEIAGQTESTLICCVTRPSGPLALFLHFMEKYPTFDPSFRIGERHKELLI